MAEEIVQSNLGNNQEEQNSLVQKYSGLVDPEIKDRRSKYGENILPVEKSVSGWMILLNQFKSPLVYIILAAAAVSLVVGEYGDFGIIMVVVIVDAVLGFIQEFNAHQTYTALKGLLKPTTTVIRNFQKVEIEVRELVPEDLVVLIAGDRVPGDGKLIESIRLYVDEAILTGESEPVAKQEAVEELEKEKSDLSRVFMGTTVVSGKGLMQVTATGKHTELGKIAVSLQEHVEEDTPLQIRLKVFSKSLTLIVILFTLAILVSGLLLGTPFLDMLRTSIILAIAAVPEGLLIAVTVILVLGMRKILKRNGLVKKLLAVETLGSVNTICTDKTGTLTEGRMRVTQVDLVDREQALQVMALCNDLEGPVDIALWEYAQGQMDQSPQNLVDSTERLAEELFSSETKFMSISILKKEDSRHIDYLKGAPEIILEMCLLDPQEKQRIIARIDDWAGEGLRLLGLVYRPHKILEDHTGYQWVGLVAMEDPIREGVVESIQVARQAGIHTKMITGDYRRTAERIGSNIGLFQEGDEILEGSELMTLSNDQLKERVQRTSIFARIRP